MNIYFPRLADFTICYGFQCAFSPTLLSRGHKSGLSCILNNLRGLFWLLCGAEKLKKKFTTKTTQVISYQISLNPGRLING